MPQEVTNVAQVHAPRPMFLTVLCVLGFIGSVTNILINGIGYFKSETEVVQIKAGTESTQIKNVFLSGKSTDTTPWSLSNFTSENFEKFSVGGVVSALLCLIGVILMWKFKKSGYYSYVLGTFFTLITHFLLFGDNFGAMGLSFIWAVIQLVIVILLSRFIGLLEEE